MKKDYCPVCEIEIKVDMKGHAKKPKHKKKAEMIILANPGKSQKWFRKNWRMGHLTVTKVRAKHQKKEANTSDNSILEHLPSSFQTFHEIEKEANLKAKQKQMKEKSNTSVLESVFAKLNVPSKLGDLCQDEREMILAVRIVASQKALEDTEGEVRLAQTQIKQLLEEKKELGGKIMYRENLVHDLRARLDKGDQRLKAQRQEIRKGSEENSSLGFKLERLEKKYGEKCAYCKSDYEMQLADKDDQLGKLQTVNERMSGKIQELQIGSNGKFLSDFKNQDRELKRK